MKLLLVQTAFLGDVVLSTPVIAGLKQLYPDAELWFMGTPGGCALLERDPLLAGIIRFDKRGAHAGVRGFISLVQQLRGHHFDAVYALQRSYRTALLLAFVGIRRRIGFRSAALSWLYHQRVVRPTEPHDVLRNLSLLSKEAAVDHLPQELRVFPPAPEQLSAPVQELLATPQGYVAVVPGSVWATKRWDADHYRTVVQQLLAEGQTVVVLGDSREQEIAARVAQGTTALNLAGKSSLAELTAIVSRAQLLICNDSMALHLGSAAKVPTVAIFCATTPRFGFGPWRNIAEVVEHPSLSCKPCARHGGMNCPTGTWACSKEVTPAAVLAAVKRVAALNEMTKAERASATNSGAAKSGAKV